MKNGVEIKSVERKSPAAKANVKAGDILLKINGSAIQDVLDYMFYAADNNLKLELLRDDKEFTVSIKKSEYDDLGLEFDTFLMDEKKTCTNKCVFCFIDQMPPGMRETLYFKDDDARLSFLQGNYVTLTNLSDKDIDRIIKMRLNINVSVHTTNPELRCKMMNNRFAGEKLKYLKMMADAGLKMNCQIVLCPGWNDGEELLRTLDDLEALMPAIQSVAVVPVGLTKYREGLTKLELYNKQTASGVLELIEARQAEFLKKYGSRVVFAADEFYLTAQKEIPNADYYEDYPQYENGVGLLRSLINEFDFALKTTEWSGNRCVGVVTGYAAYDTILSLAKKAMDKYQGLDVKVYRIRNDFFGETITVSGLLTAQDIIKQMSEQIEDTEWNEMIISSSMLRAGSNVFLDDLTTEDIEKALRVRVAAVANDGAQLLEAMLGI